MNRPLTAGVLAALLLLVSGCAAPERQYIAADSYGMYFALPQAWSAVPGRDLVAAEAGWTDDVGNVFNQTVVWQGAWTDGSGDASTIFAAEASARPAVFAFVRDLISVEQQSVTGSDINTALRDVVLPTTSIQDAGGDVRTERISDGDFRGIHQLATYAAGGSLSTTEVVTMLAPSKNRVYALLVRCSAACFDRNTGTINDVFDSLTFKERRGQ